MCSECKKISLSQQSSSSSTSNKNQNDKNANTNDKKEEEASNNKEDKRSTNSNQDKNEGNKQSESITSIDKFDNNEKESLLKISTKFEKEKKSIKNKKKSKLTTSSKQSTTTLNKNKQQTKTNEKASSSLDSEKTSTIQTTSPTTSLDMKTTSSSTNAKKIITPTSKTTKNTSSNKSELNKNISLRMNEPHILPKDKKRKLSIKLTNPKAKMKKHLHNDNSDVEIELNENAVPNRYKNHSRITYAFKTTKENEEKMLEIISKNLGIDSPVESKFSNMSNAKEFFFRHFSAIYDFGDHIFHCPYPTSCQHLLPENESEPNNNISLSFRDVKSCFDTNELNDGLLSFASKLLNFYSYHTKEQNEIPSIIFGDPLDINELIFTTNFHSEVYDYINLITPLETFEEDRMTCISGMKQWYCYESKHYLRRLMDYYDKKNQVLNKFGTIVNCGGAHWIYIEINISPKNENEEPSVVSIDNLGGGTGLSWHIRRSFAKYYGLYVKDTVKKLPLTDYDFDGHDLIDDKKANDPFKRQKENIYPSMLKHYALKPKFCQADSYNCGIISFVHCLEAYKNKETFHTLEIQKQIEFVHDLRLRLLSIVSDLWLLFNFKEYDCIKDHVFMEHGEIENKKSLEKWKFVHYLFDNGIFTYRKENNDKNTTANLVFEQNNITKLRKMLPPKTKHGTSKTSTSNTTSKKNKTNKKQLNKSQHQSTSDTDMEKEDDASTESDQSEESVDAGLIKEEKDLSLSHLYLHNSPNDRRFLHDINDQYTYCANGTIANDKPNHPSNMIKRLLTFFTYTYCVGKSQEEKDYFQSKVKELMIKYPTYFIMDVVYIEKLKTEKYVVIAALILEESVFLRNVEHAIIHLVSIRPDFEEKNHIKMLLYHVMLNTSIDNKRLYFIFQFGTYTFQYLFNDDSDVEEPRYKTPEYIFQELKFTECYYECLDKLIEPNSRYLYGNGHNFYAPCRGREPSGGKARICYVHDYVKHMCMYSSEKGHFELYSHPFKWKDCSREHVQYIPPMIRKFCKNHPDKKVELKGGGNRNVILSGNIASTNFKWKFRDEFQIQDSRFANCCVWLSAVLLIDRSHSCIATYMLQLMDNQLSNFEWMFICKVPKAYKIITTVRLIDWLQTKQIGFILTKVPIKALKQTYLDYMFDKKTTGQYICQLESIGGCKNHVVGIDCDEKAIVDSCETHALKLTKSNLDHCCGRYLKGIKQIAYCYQLIKRK